MKTYISCATRLCGADDCPLCHPENFKLIEGTLVYIDDWPETSSPPPVFHNPENVPPRYLGEGWRFCTVDEIRKPPKDAEMFISECDWRYRIKPDLWLVDNITYRTRTPLPE